MTNPLSLHSGICHTCDKLAEAPSQAIYDAKLRMRLKFCTEVCFKFYNEDKERKRQENLILSIPAKRTSSAAIFRLII